MKTASLFPVTTLWRLLTLICLSAGMWTAFAASAAEKRPNILYIFTDDQSHRTVSSYEDARPWVNTPNIDRLAAEGVRFKHAFAGPWCAPSRAMALTGRYLHGIEGLDFSAYPSVKFNPERFKMWPQAFKENGYRTALIGKWHLGDEYAHGSVWDRSIVWNRLREDVAGSYFRDQKLRFDGGDYQPVGGHSTDNYTKYAVDFISGDHAKPWVLWLCYDAVHAPFTPADRHEGAYKDAGPIPVPDDVYPPRPTKPRYMKDYAMIHRSPESGRPIEERTGLPLDELVQKYNSGVLALDEGVGALLKCLEDTGQLESTIIVFTSDQGLAMGHHGMSIKVAPYDDNIRVPMLVRLPAASRKGAVVEAPVNHIDLVPTFFDYAGIELPWEMHGESLRPVLETDAELDRGILQENFSKSFGSETDSGITGPKPNQAVDWWIFYRYRNYKYIATLVADEIEELYDIEADPKELTNLALDSQYEGVVAEYRARMIAELKRTKAGLADSLPEPRKAY